MPQRLSCEVTPKERPTVPKAETTSKRYFRKNPSLWGEIFPSGWVIKRRKVIKVMKETAITKMATTFRTISLGTVLLKTLTAAFPVSLFHIKDIKTAKEVVLTPPPHEPGEAPINMKIISINKTALCRKFNSTVLKPAVLAVTDWKKDKKNL